MLKDALSRVKLQQNRTHLEDRRRKLHSEFAVRLEALLALNGMQRYCRP